MILPKTPDKPRWQEYYIMAYVFSLAVEKFRQVSLIQQNLSVASPTSKLELKKQKYTDPKKKCNTSELLSKVVY